MDPLIQLHIPTTKTSNPPVVLKVGLGTLYYSGPQLVGIKTPTDAGLRLGLAHFYGREKTRVNNHYKLFGLDAGWVGTASKTDLYAKAAKLCSETYAQYARERIAGAP